MNSSLSQKWNEINKRSAITKREGMSSTLGGQVIGGGSRIGGGLNASIGASATTQPQQEQPPADGGATNQDLTRRLAEMKAKLQALKKK